MPHRHITRTLTHGSLEMGENKSNHGVARSNIFTLNHAYFVFVRTFYACMYVYI